jgi:hypothetical protein
MYLVAVFSEKTPGVVLLGRSRHLLDGMFAIFAAPGMVSWRWAVVRNE